MAETDEIETDNFFDEPKETALAESPESKIALPGTLGQMQTAAEFLSKSTIIPAVYQNKPSNCFVALEFAQRIGCNAMMVMQNLDIIQGKPSWSSKFMIAVANDCGKYTPIRYEMSGTEGEDDWGCRAYMTEIATGEKLEGVKVTMKMAKDEGWYDKRGSKWKTMPELMMRYRAAAFLIRTYAPELTMGLHTVEEREDMINVTPPREESAAEKAWREQNEK
ncbi:hypothetical protein Ga0466249_004751 [Sporomusaceae bacterium BoRhaA]|uniref:recombinase RecT n=1 Tax=Pelorhabdus rhamnosifermentans TaxID=2772457 RepID=UPI001C05F550|nr:recombinase RecT [Pelorhabdus rhamnosifermentans]MBU2703606.1 hypothetical protein [Pelorhabdus rhamnosifermentans]